MRKAALVGVSIFAVGILSFTVLRVGVSLLLRYGILSSDEEAPIRVKNGSLEIITGAEKDNEWGWQSETGDNEDASPSYSYEPVNKYRDRSRVHWVKVASMASGACTDSRMTASGKEVIITYKYDNGQQTKSVKIARGASGPLRIDYRTKVRPSDLTVGKDPDTGRPALIFSPAAAGYISAFSVESDHWSCSFSDANAKPELLVCSSSNRTECN
jgi:hypothetical protein